MIFGTHSASMNAILIGSFILVLVGVIDDITELSAKTQFIGQLAAARYAYNETTANNAIGFRISFYIN